MIAVTDRIIRGTSGVSPFAVAWEDDLKLGNIIVADIAARDAIPEWKRVPFMSVKVIAESTTYELGADTTIAGQVWTEQTFGVPDDVLTEDDILGDDGKIKPSLISNIFLSDSYVVADEAARLALTTVTGNFIIQEDDSSVWVKLNDDSPAGAEDFAELSFPGAVLSVNGQVGAVSITIANLLAVGANLTSFEAAVAAAPSVAGLGGSITTINGIISSLSTDKADVTYVDSHILGYEMTDPNANAFTYWNDAEGEMQFLKIGTGFEITGDTIAAIGSGGTINVLDDLQDVIITTASTGDIIRYDGANWINQPFGAGGHIIQNAGLSLANQTKLNFTGGLTAVDDVPNTATVAKLGGSLIENVNIDGAFDFKFGDTVNLTSFVAKADLIVLMATGVAGSAGVRYNNGGGVINNLYVSEDGVEVELTATKIFAAIADYSADFVPLSYIHKGYADATYAPISGSANYWLTTGTTTVTTPVISGKPVFDIGTFTTKYVMVRGDLSTDLDVPLLTFHNSGTIATGRTDIALGANNLSASTVAVSNVAIGHSNFPTFAPLGTSAGAYNVGIGYKMGFSFGVPNGGEGSYNVLIGHDSVSNATAATRGIALGYQTFKDVIGFFRLSDFITIGTRALSSATFGANNEGGVVAIGHESMFGAISLYDGGKASTGFNGSIAIGRNAGYASQIEAFNVILGTEAAYQSSLGRGNIVMGHSAARNMTGAVAGTTGEGNNNSFNVMIGVHSGEYLNGNKNTYIGVESGKGGDAINNRVNGEQNSGFGNWAMVKVTGNLNTGLGSYAGFTSSGFLTGSGNTFVGFSSGFNTSNSTFDRVIVIGNATGLGTTQGYRPAVTTGNVYIGSVGSIFLETDWDGTKVTYTFSGGNITNGTGGDLFWRSTGTTTLLGATTIAMAGFNHSYLNGNVLFAPTGATITAATRQDVRGVSAGNVTRWASDVNTTLGAFQNDGIFYLGTAPISGGVATFQNSSTTASAVQYAHFKNLSSNSVASARIVFGNDEDDAGIIVRNSSTNTGLGGTRSFNINTSSNAVPLSLGSNSALRFNIGGTGLITFSNSPTSFTSTWITFTQSAATTGTITGKLFTGGAHTGLTASVESTDINYNLARTVQFSTGALTLQRAFRIQAPTYAFVAASTLTDAITFDVGGVPVQGTNATITRAWSARFNGNTVILSGGLSVGATSMATAELPTGRKFQVTLAADATESSQIGNFRVVTETDGGVRMGSGSTSGYLTLTGDNLVGSAAYLQLRARNSVTSKGYILHGGSNHDDTVIPYYSIIRGVSLNTGNVTNIEGGALYIYGGSKATAGIADGSILLAITEASAVRGAVGIRASVVTANTSLDVRGVSAGNIQRWGSNVNTTRGVFQDDGILYLGAAAISIGGLSARFQLSETINNLFNAIEIRNHDAGSSARSRLIFGNDTTNEVTFQMNSSTATSIGGAGSFNIMGEGGNIFTLGNNNTVRYTMSSSGAHTWTTGLTGGTSIDFTFTQNIRTSGVPTGILFTGAAHTTLTASTEATDINYNLARTVEFATGALTTQRAFRIQAPTYAFVGASTITNASTLSISGAPVQGTNATITNAWALNVEAGNVKVVGSLALFGAETYGGGVGVVAIKNAGTAPTASITDGVLLYAEDVAASSELKVRDEAGNVTTLSPHNFSLIPNGSSEEGAWAHMSEYTNKSGKREKINADMLALIRTVEELYEKVNGTKKKLVFKAAA